MNESKPESAAQFLADQMCRLLPDIVTRELAASGPQPSVVLPIVAGWFRCTDDGCGHATVVFGSPHGGPIMRALITDSDPVTMHDDAHRLGALYDEQQARANNITRPQLIARVESGDPPAGYLPYEGGPGWKPRPEEPRIAVALAEDDDEGALLIQIPPAADYDTIRETLLAMEARAEAFRRKYGLDDMAPWTDDQLERALTDCDYPSMALLPSTPQGRMAEMVVDADLEDTENNRRKWRRVNAAHLLGHAINEHADPRCDACRTWGRP